MGLERAAVGDLEGAELQSGVLLLLPWRFTGQLIPWQRLPPRAFILPWRIMRIMRRFRCEFLWPGGRCRRNQKRPPCLFPLRCSLGMQLPVIMSRPNKLCWQGRRCWSWRPRTVIAASWLSFRSAATRPRPVPASSTKYMALARRIMMRKLGYRGRFERNCKPGRDETWRCGP